MSGAADGWLTDANGNRASVGYFGSIEAAQAALDSLENCERCVNCLGCSRCSGCAHLAFLRDKVGISAEPSAATAGAPAVPRIENIHQKVYAAVSQPKALDMSNRHKCETTHCRAGWITTLAGPAGKALEDFHNPELAAMLIYYESGYHIHPARFFDSNERAIADMKRLAEAEAKGRVPS